MNTSTQQQKATERSAPGLSLLASQVAASLQRHVQFHEPIHGNVDADRWALRTIRGEHP